MCAINDSDRRKTANASPVQKKIMTLSTTKLIASQRKKKVG